MNFSDLIGIVDCCIDDHGWREGGRLIFKHHFTESEGSVVYSQKFVASSSPFIAPVYVYLYGFSITCFTPTFVLLSTVFLLALSGKLFCI